MSGFFIILQAIVKCYDEAGVSFDSAGLSGWERISVLEGAADGRSPAGVGQVCCLGSVLDCGIFAFHIHRPP